METWGSMDENGLSEYVRFREVVEWCYKQAVTSTAPERVDLVVPRVEEVRRGLRTRVDAQEKTLMLKPGEAIWYDGERDIWQETKRVLKEDAAAKECTISACSMIDLKKIPLLVLIKVVEPMDIFPPVDIADAIRAHALDTHFRLKESLQDLDVEQHDGHLPKRRRSNLLHPRSAQQEQNNERVEDDSRPSDGEVDQEAPTRKKFPHNINEPAVGGIDDEGFTGIHFANCKISSSDDEDDDIFLRKYFPNVTTPSEDEADNGTKKPTSATHRDVGNDQESADDEYHDGTHGPTCRAQRSKSTNEDDDDYDGTHGSTFQAECSLDAGISDLDDPDHHCEFEDHVWGCYCCYS